MCLPSLAVNDVGKPGEESFVAADPKCDKNNGDGDDDGESKKNPPNQPPPPPPSEKKQRAVTKSTEEKKVNAQKVNMKCNFW